MHEDLRVVFESRNRRACADRSLVLSAAGIPHQVVNDDGGSAIVVPAEMSGRAAEELRLYDEENPPQRPKPAVNLETMDPVPGVVAYLLVIVGVAWLDAAGAFGEIWRNVGRIDGELYRDGEWWRAVTALTLHGGLQHLAGNIVFGALFGTFAGRFVGSGVAWLTILLCAALGNSMNTLLLEATHRSIGASTAVFAALGLASGFAWRARVFRDERWTYRVGPIVGGLALLAFTGTGDSNTDIGAHLMGFVAGFGGGVYLTRLRKRLHSDDLQRGAGALAIGIITLCWIIALSS
ncbi:MAG: rhomboid family intramembrane serine protease [Woeseiaceae bacterium]|nr:rhomboid family intramembrane serine protease [Woeseiaceae bacterium]